MNAEELLGEPVTSKSEDSVYALAPEPALRVPPPAKVRPASLPPVADRAERACSSCGAMLEAGDRLCVRCGTMAESGRVLATKQARALASQRGQRRAAQIDEARQRVRAVVVPAVLFAAGVSLFLALHGTIKGMSSEESLLLLAAFAAGKGLLCGVIYLCCCALWIGLNAGVGITILRMLAVTALATGVAAGFWGSLAPITLGTVVAGLAMVWLMEEDFDDMWLAAGLSYGLPSAVLMFVPLW